MAVHGAGSSRAWLSGAWLRRGTAPGRTDLKAELGRGGANAGLWVEDEDAGPDLGGQGGLGMVWRRAPLFSFVLYEL